MLFSNAVQHCKWCYTKLLGGTGEPDFSQGGRAPPGPPQSRQCLEQFNSIIYFLMFNFTLNFRFAPYADCLVGCWFHGVNKSQLNGCMQGAFSIEYFPLKAGSGQGKLELTSNELGLYLYDLELKAAPSAPEKTLNFQTCLGSSQTLTAKFTSYAKHKTDYSCKVCHHIACYNLHLALH